ncbi:hypothetical protein Tco_0237172 [Tanacetum coccineum]
MEEILPSKKSVLDSPSAPSCFPGLLHLHGSKSKAVGDSGRQSDLKETGRKEFERTTSWLRKTLITHDVCQGGDMDDGGRDELVTEIALGGSEGMGAPYGKRWLGHLQEEESGRRKEKGGKKTLKEGGRERRKGREGNGLRGSGKEVGKEDRKRRKGKERKEEERKERGGNRKRNWTGGKAGTRISGEELKGLVLEERKIGRNRKWREEGRNPRKTLGKEGERRREQEGSMRRRE